MSSPTLNYPLREWIATIVPSVFETMLSLQPTPAAAGAAPNVGSGERVSGAIGIAGETLTGAVYLHLTLAFAHEITRMLLSYGSDENPTPAEINDVVGEFCNMTSGKLKSLLADHGAPCAMSPPSIIRGSAFAIESMQGAQAETIHFECLTHRLSVEIHLHPQDL